MDLTQFLYVELDAPGHEETVERLRSDKTRLEAALAWTNAELKRHGEADAALNGLRQGDASVFFSNSAEHWLFVARYAAVADRSRTGRLTEVECVVIPEAVVDQNRHRPIPHEDPAQAARGVVTMTSMPVPGDVLARELASAYASGVRIGTYADALTEPCGVCGKRALVVCQHSWDHDSGVQWMGVHRLCPNCPCLVEIASECWDTDEASSLLPPKHPPKRRF